MAVDPTICDVGRVSYAFQMNAGEIRDRQTQAYELAYQPCIRPKFISFKRGQKKMVQLIALLSLDHQFLMLDEPFAGLDQESQ